MEGWQGEAGVGSRDALLTHTSFQSGAFQIKDFFQLSLAMMAQSLSECETICFEHLWPKQVRFNLSSVV